MNFAVLPQQTCIPVTLHNQLWVLVSTLLNEVFIWTVNSISIKFDSWLVVIFSVSFYFILFTVVVVVVCVLLILVDKQYSRLRYLRTEKENLIYVYYYGRLFSIATVQLNRIQFRTVCSLLSMTMMMVMTIKGAFNATI